MIDFNEELLKFKPSLDVDDIEDTIGEIDLTDMNDIVMKLLKNMSEKNSISNRNPITNKEGNSPNSFNKDEQ